MTTTRATRVPDAPALQDSGAHEPPLGARLRYGFAVGDFGLNLYWQGLGLFLIYFQTDVLGIPASWAGLCYLIASVWDGLSDPIMGVIADRTRTRWGRYRPYLLLGSVPLALAFALSFSAPQLPLPWLIAYSLATQMLVRALYTALAIPYSSLSVVITHSSDARTRLTGLRMQFAFLGGIAVAYLLPSLAGWLGSGTGAQGYGYAALLIGALATGVFGLCFVAVPEPPGRAAGRNEAGPLPPLVSDARAFLRLVARSQPLLRVLLGKLLVVFTLTMHTRNTVYYLKYTLGAVDAVGTILPLLTAASFASVPLWVLVTRRTSKRGTWLLGAAGTIAFSLGIQFVPAPSRVLGVFLLCGVAASTSAFAVAFWAMLPDTVEYNELHFGRRDEAKLFGIASMAQKIAMGLSAAASGWFLEASGFVANTAQLPGAVDAIRTTMGLAPAAGALLSVVVMQGYRIDAAEHRRILQALQTRSPA